MTKDSDRTSSQADFLANLSVSQEKENQKKMTEISGRKLLGLSKSPDPLFLLEKMLVESLNSISTPYLRTWRVQTTPRGALIFQLRASVRTTKDKESGLLPTPRATNPGSRPNQKGGKVLEEEVLIAAGLRERGKTLAQMYPTPRSCDLEGGGSQECGNEQGELQQKKQKGSAIRSETKRRSSLFGETKTFTDSDNARRKEQCQSKPNEKKNKTFECSNWWQTQSELRGIPDGISYGLDKDRTNRIKGLGNAIVPQIPFYIGQAIGRLYE